MKSYRYKIKELDCANCALKLERHLNEDKNLNNVKVNFNKLSLSFETEMTSDIKKYVTKVGSEVEDGLELLEINEDNNNSKITTDILLLLLGIILTIIGIVAKIKIITIIAYIVLLYDIAIYAIKTLIKSFNIDEHLLITISCIGAFFIGHPSEGLMVVILYKIGKILEKIAVNRSRKSITDLMDIAPTYANLKQKNDIVKVSPEEVKIGDVIIVKKGEKIPLDGIVIKGETNLDTSALTGESKLRFVTKDDEVLSGSINRDEIIEIKVTSLYEDSTVSNILNLVENATESKAKTENFISVAARIYTPAVLILAIIAFILLPFIFDISYNESLYRALCFLVISCPCAIVISVPLSYFSGIGRASKEGILVKGSDYLDGLRLIKTMIFDKTGTITSGNFDNLKLVILNDKYKKDEIIDIYLKGEMLSNHPISKSIIKEFGKKIDSKDVKNYKEIAGKGISFTIGKDKYLIGSHKLVESPTKDNSIYLKKNNDILAKIELTDSIKPKAKETIKELNKMNIDTLMFTGDEEEISKEIGANAEITTVAAELLPEDKYNLLEETINKQENGKVSFVGDGINDAPSLARSDIGISMGNVGSAAAIEASDVVIVNDDISKIVSAINISKTTHRIIVENLVFALGIKLLVLILSACGIANMWQAVFADTGLTLLTIINSTRILSKKKY